MATDLISALTNSLSGISGIQDILKQRAAQRQQNQITGTLIDTLSGGVGVEGPVRGAIQDPAKANLVSSLIQSTVPGERAYGLKLAQEELEMQRRATLPPETRYTKPEAATYQGKNVFFQADDKGNFKILEGLAPIERQFVAKAEQTTPGGANTGTGIVPSSSKKPWSNLQTIKETDKVKATERQKGIDRIDDLTKGFSALDSMEQQLKRFQFLNQSNSTGRLTSLPGIQGLRESFDAGFQEMNSIASSIVPKMREPGSGATSDFDAKMFQRATIGVDKAQDVNDAIINAQVIHIQRQREKVNFLNDYLAENGHIGPEAEKEWRRYINANPIFDKNAPEGSFTLNPNRRTYQEFFSGSSDLYNKYGLER